MDWLSKIFGAETFWMAILLVHIKSDRLQDRPKHRAMSMPMAAAWIGYQKSWGPMFLDGDFSDPYKNRSLASSAQNPNDDHAHGSGMDWLSKIFGAEKFWIAILLIHIKNDCLRHRPKPERWACPWQRHELAIQNFRDRKLLDVDSVDSNEN